MSIQARASEPRVWERTSQRPPKHKRVKQTSMKNHTGISELMLE